MKEKRTAASESVRGFLQAVKSRFFDRLGEKKAKRLLLSVAVAAVALILLAVALLLIPVNSIEITGDVEMFNEGDIVEASGIGEGDRLFLHPFFTISGSIKRSLPLVEKVTVIKNPFNGHVKIDVRVRDVEFYTMIGDKYYAIDEDLRILDSSVKRSKYSSGGAAFVKLPEVREPVLGEILVFYDTVEETDSDGELLYPVRDKKYYDYASDFLHELKKSGFLAQTDGVDLEQKFDLRIVYDMKYQVRFGGSYDLGAKFKVLFGILREGTVAEYKEKTVVDVSKPSMATARIDLTLDFSEFDD